MKIRTIFQLFLLCVVLNSVGCKSTGPGSTPATVEEAEEQIAKKREKEKKAYDKAMKKAKKAYWKRQSKATRNSVKRNERAQRKLMRKKRRQERFNWEDQDRWEGQ